MFFFFFFCQASDTGAEGIDKLIDVLKASTFKPKRDPTGPFIFSVDHCFSIRGQGTVMTGTALSGGLNINDVIFQYRFCPNAIIYVLLMYLGDN